MSSTCNRTKRAPCSAHAGDNDEGQLGDGSTQASTRPRLITSLQGTCNKLYSISHLFQLISLLPICTSYVSFFIHSFTGKNIRHVCCGSAHSVFWTASANELQKSPSPLSPSASASLSPRSKYYRYSDKYKIKCLHLYTYLIRAQRFTMFIL